MPGTMPARIAQPMASATGSCDQAIRPATSTPHSPATWPTDRSNSPLATATVRPDEITISTEICTRMLLMFSAETKRPLASANTAKISKAAPMVP